MSTNEAMRCENMGELCPPGPDRPLKDCDYSPYILLIACGVSLLLTLLDLGGRGLGNGASEAPGSASQGFRAAPSSAQRTEMEPGFSELVLHGFLAPLFPVNSEPPSRSRLPVFVLECLGCSQ